MPGGCGREKWFETMMILKSERDLEADAAGLRGGGAVLTKCRVHQPG
jgi:hypothetical protein